MNTVYGIIYGVGFLFIVGAVAKSWKDIKKERNGEEVDNGKRDGYSGF